MFTHHPPLLQVCACFILSPLSAEIVETCPQNLSSKCRWLDVGSVPLKCNTDNVGALKTKEQYSHSAVRMQLKLKWSPGFVVFQWSGTVQELRFDYVTLNMTSIIVTTELVKKHSADNKSVHVMRNVRQMMIQQVALELNVEIDGNSEIPNEDSGRRALYICCISFWHLSGRSHHIS